MTYFRNTGQQYVYFIKPKGACGPVKIGLSECPEFRMKSSGHWVPIPLELAVKIPGDRFLEGRFHRFFLDCHSHLEWFDMTTKLHSVIERIKAGIFDYDELPEYSKPLRFLVKDKLSIEAERAQ